MEELTFSVFDHGPGSIASMQELLKKFEQQEGIRVRLEVLGWDVGWPRMVEVALYQHGPDVSQIGNTWVMDFVHMNALEPFSAEEINTITDGMRFFEPSWNSCVTATDNQRQVWAIPWSGDVRVMYYRRDLLAQAGIDESTAFENAESIENTLKSLKQNGVNTPLAIQTLFSRISVHNLASWVWGAGGDFLSPDSKHVLFHQEPALSGIQSYFRLGKYLGPNPLRDDGQADEEFWSGRAAMTLSGYWVMRDPRMPETVQANMRLTQLPGVSFVGGHNLVVWKHSRHRKAAIRLLKFLGSQAAEPFIYPNFGLPLRESGWTASPFDSPNFGIFRSALHAGRSFPTGRLWGLVEKRLAELMPVLWQEVLQNPQQADSIIKTQIGNIANRLEMAISN